MVREYLKSNDIEMVRLGAILLEETVPEEYWIMVLDTCLSYPSYYTISDSAIQIHSLPQFSNLFIKDPTRLLRIVPKSPRCQK